MTTPAELKRLIELSVADPRNEPTFLHALLDAELYVHLPLSDDSSRMRLVCFTRPDGLTVIPVFSDEGKARVAGQGAVRVGAVCGRELFMSAPGATFMLDPNDTTTTLYPEEISALLSSGEAAVAPGVVQNAQISLSPAASEDRWIGELVADAVKGIDAVRAVHLANMHVAGCTEPTGFVAIVAVPAAWSERAARAAALALHTNRRAPRLPVDLTTYDPADQPDWVSAPGFGAVWTRTRCGVH